MSNFKCTRWQMIEQTGVIDINSPYPTTHGDPSNYQYAELPFPNDPRWTDAPTDGQGKLHFKRASNITGYNHASRSYSKVEFSYFRAYVLIPKGADIQQFQVTISKVDDGARMYLFNNSYVGGTYTEADDAKLAGSNVRTDFTDKVVHGWNMVLIVQFDDCPGLNNLTGGVEIRINNQVVEPDTTLEVPEVAFAPARFQMETYGIHGQGRTGQTYWIGWNGKASIITNSEEANEEASEEASEEANEAQQYLFDIEKVEVENGIALKVTNYHGAESGKDYYLPDLQNDPHVYAIKPPLEHKRDLTQSDEYNFISLESVSTENAYLRHRGFVLYNETGNASQDTVYRQDCTWHFHEINQ